MFPGFVNTNKATQKQQFSQQLKQEKRTREQHAGERIHPCFGTFQNGVADMGETDCGHGEEFAEALFAALFVIPH